MKQKSENIIGFNDPGESASVERLSSTENDGGTSTQSDAWLTQICSRKVRATGPSREERQRRAVEIVKNLGCINDGRYKPVEPQPEPPPIPPDQTYSFLGCESDPALQVGEPIVYFIYCAGRIKIGFTTNLRFRHEQFRNAFPFPPVVLLVMKGALPAERKLHAKFAAERLHGEWFVLSDKLRRFLRRKCCPIGRASLRKAEDQYTAGEHR